MPPQQQQQEGVENPRSLTPQVTRPNASYIQMASIAHQFDRAILLAFKDAVDALRVVLQTDRDLITFREPLRRIVIEHMVIGYFDSQHVSWLNDFKNKYSLDMVVASTDDDINLGDDLLEQRVALFEFFDKCNKRSAGQSSVAWQKKREDWVVCYQKDLLQKWTAAWTNKQSRDEGAGGHKTNTTSEDRL